MAAELEGQDSTIRLSKAFAFIVEGYSKQMYNLNTPNPELDAVAELEDHTCIQVRRIYCDNREH